MTETAKKIESLLREKLALTDFQLRDDSHLHAGHRGNTGGGHYFVQLRSPKFDGLGLLARQRLVYDALGDMMRAEIHALSMKCLGSQE